MEVCLTCARWAVSRWRGWPIGPGRRQDPLPDIPRTPCSRCGGIDSIDDRRIAWRAMHSEFSTGLPEYWYLVILDPGEEDGPPSRFGRPYVDGTALRCSLDDLTPG